MKKLMLLVMALLLGCVTERYVKVTNDSLEKVLLIQTTVRIDDTAQTINGGGVFISKYGHILTCAHILPDTLEAGNITVSTYNKESYGGELLFKDKRLDLALLKINAYTPHFAKIQYPSRLKLGQELIVIGHPFGYSWTVSHGIISVLYDDEFGYSMLQTDAAMNAGNSGGPIFDRNGKLIGIANSLFSPVSVPLNIGLGFGIAPTSIWKFLDRFKYIPKD